MMRSINNFLNSLIILGALILLKSACASQGVTTEDGYRVAARITRAWHLSNQIEETTPGEGYEYGDLMKTLDELDQLDGEVAQ